MSRRLLGEKELLDIIQGATFLGTGGGGSPESGEVVYKRCLAGKRIELVTVDEVEDDANIAVVAGMGAPEALKRKGWSTESVNAFNALEKVVGVTFDYVIPIETGGFNSITPMTVTAERGIPTIDADGAGRAIPELEMTMFYMNDIPVSPTALADDTNIWAVLNAEDTFKMEEIARAVTTALGMQAGIVCHKMSGKQMKQVVIKDTVTKAESVGRAIREANNAGKDPVVAVLGAVDGVLLGKGKVTNVATETKGGFDFGKVTVAAEGSTLRVDYKNENMLAWSNDKLVAVVPDNICYISTAGQPLTNADIEEGMDIAVIGTRAPDRWRVTKGFEVFRKVLEAMGYTEGYKKIEDLNK
jgi:DUF917 family protein